MKKVAAAALVLLLAACGDAPAPKAVEKKPAVEPKVEAKAAQAPKVEAPKAEAPKPDPNKALAQRVKRALEDQDKTQAAGIDVTATDGTVTLWGTAATVAERRRAAQTAAKVEGVKSVSNRIAVVKGS
jgi:osmotically-inducible protein OsmY